MLEFHYLVDADELDENETQVSFVADDEARDGLAKQLGLVALEQFDVTASLRKRSDGVVVAVGTIHAAVVQRCVATLELLESAIEEPFEVLFAPQQVGTEAGEVNIEPGGDDIEPFSGGRIDLGATAREYLALAIDPYPRKVGAEFHRETLGEETESPFAVLAKLRSNL